MTTAFVLSGGGSLGSVQVGMLRALTAKGITPDMVVGTSVGALNAAWIAFNPGTADGLAELWLGIRRSDVFPVRPLAGLGAILRRNNFLVPPDNLRALLGRHLPEARIEDAPIPLHVVATVVTSGLEIVLSRGELMPALLASAAIPGVFPPVEIDGRVLMDGGVANNTPICHAIALGADDVYVLPTGYACALKAAPRTPLGVAMQALTLLVEGRLIQDVQRYEKDARLHVMPPLCPLAVPATDFTQAGTLMQRAERATADWLDESHGPYGQAEFLGLHDHRE